MKTREILEKYKKDYLEFPIEFTTWLKSLDSNGVETIGAERNEEGKMAVYKREAFPFDLVPTHVAAYCGIKLSSVEYPYININKRDASGSTPLDYAVKQNNIEIIDDMLVLKARLSSIYFPSNVSPEIAYKFFSKGETYNASEDYVKSILDQFSPKKQELAPKKAEQAELLKALQELQSSIENEDTEVTELAHIVENVEITGNHIEDSFGF